MKKIVVFFCSSMVFCTLSSMNFLPKKKKKSIIPCWEQCEKDFLIHKQKITLMNCFVACCDKFKEENSTVNESWCEKDFIKAYTETTLAAFKAQKKRGEL